MADGTQIAADVMEKGGAAVAIGSGIISFLMHVIGFMDHHSPAILSMCGIVGAVVSVKGHMDKARILTAEEARKQEEHDLKMTELRNQ